MDFIREVIDVANENEPIDARKNITKIVSEVKNYQSKIKSYIDDNYTDFLPNLSNNQMYLGEAEHLCQEIDMLMENTVNETQHELLTAREDLQPYLDELLEVKLGLYTSFKILKIDHLFQSIEDSKHNQEYLRVMEYCEEIKQLMDDPDDEILPNLDCYPNIKIRRNLEKELLLHNLKLKLDSLVQFTEKSFQHTKSITLKIVTDESKLHDILFALCKLKFNTNRMFDFLMTNVFVPIITRPVSMNVTESDPESITVHLSYGTQPIVFDLKPNYSTVFDNLKIVFKSLLHMNISISDNVSIFNILSDQIQEKFLQLLLRECLSYSIPNTMDEMNESSIVDDLIEFDQFLKSIKFLNETDHQLTDYANKIGILFRNRFCLNILDSAVAIMHRDLHDMMMVGDIDSMSAPKSDQALFPRCMISKSTMEIINLLEKVMKELRTAPDDIMERLLSTVPIILNRYINEVPEYHEKLLQNIPQQTALFHNNCMYLAHWTLMSGHTERIDEFATVAKSLQLRGTKLFVQQIHNQQLQLIDILIEFEIPDSISEINNPIVTTQPLRAIRQCLRQLDLLKNVWQTILPDVVYNKTVGNLLDEFCHQIVQRICSLEDIPSMLSLSLVDVLDNVIDRAPSIFKDPQQISVHVKSWTKLTQLKMILNASMVEIKEQWSEGKGPLTLNYKADEIKHLIRALFQNTDHRANVLSTIS